MSSDKLQLKHLKAPVYLFIIIWEKNKPKHLKATNKSLVVLQRRPKRRSKKLKKK
jgi:hypothetical protein